MSIKHHVSLYLYGSEYNTPTTLAWPAPLPPATLEGDRNTTLLNLSWTGAYKPISIRGGSIIVTRQSGGEIFRLELRRGLFPPGARGRLAFEAKGFTGANQLYDIEVYIELDHTGDLGTDIQAGSFVAALVTQRSQDVCIYFPRCGRRLWSDEASLLKMSPYFDALQSSEFYENDMEAHAANKEEEDPSITMASYEYDDSDEETDKLTEAHKSTDEGLETPGLLYKTTFEAGVNDQNGETRTRTNVVADSLQLTEPRSPAPVSPKSIYRLAHYLQISGLPDIALSNFKSQLSRDNVMYELYSDIASKYSDVRDVALCYAVKYWKDVVKTSGYKEVMEKGRDEGLDGVTGLLLSENLMERWAK